MMLRLKSIFGLLSQEEWEELQKSRAIDKELRVFKRKSKFEIKILMLGAGESGKSTFLKQMRIVHGDDFTDEEVFRFKETVHQNILESMHSVLRAMETYKFQFEKEENRENAELINQIKNYSEFKIDMPHWKALKELWDDSGIQECLKKGNEYNLLDSTEYFYTNLDRISQSDFKPTIQDILRTRVPTTGLNEYEFRSEGNLFRIVDVSGQRSERKKWIKCFEGVVSSIFLAAISEYDQVLRETEAGNRLEESRDLFRIIISYPYFQQTSFMMFFNKCDLLEKKIATSHLADYFPEFTQEKGNAEAARIFIRDMFMDLNDNKERKMYNHFTCATDTHNIQRVFSDVRHTILDTNLGAYGIV